MVKVSDTTAPKKIRILVGVATVVNSKDGAVIEAMFDPMVKIKDCTDLVSALKQIEEPIEKQAELIVATWFQKLNIMEESDPDKFHMVTTDLGIIDMQEKFPKNTYPDESTGHRFLFTFEEI